MDDRPSPIGWRARLRGIPPVGIGGLIVIMIILKGTSVEVIISIAMLMLAAAILARAAGGR